MIESLIDGGLRIIVLLAGVWGIGLIIPVAIVGYLGEIVKPQYKNKAQGVFTALYLVLLLLLFDLIEGSAFGIWLTELF